MSRIYRALEVVGKERAFAPRRAAAPLPRPTVPLGLEEKLVSLLRRLDGALTAKPARVIAVAGAQGGGGSAALAHQMALIAASRVGKSTLLLRALHDAPSPAMFRGAALDWNDVTALGRKNGSASAGERVDPLVVARIATTEDRLVDVLTSPDTSATFSALEKQFDLILVDAPPLDASSGSAILSGMVDGVVVVVESEQTRWPIVQHAKEQIAAHGGTLLGVVLNNRRHYIPDAIYKRL